MAKTKKEMFAELKAIEAVAANEELVTFIDHEIQLLEKKSNSAKKPTKTQIENANLKAEILAYLTEADSPKCIKELQAEIPSLSELTNQRITHLLTDLKNAELIVKQYNKKVPYYSVA